MIETVTTRIASAAARSQDTRVSMSASWSNARRALRDSNEWKRRVMGNESELQHRQSFRPISRLPPPTIATARTEFSLDMQLVKRIIDSYNKSYPHYMEDASIWSGHFGGAKSEVHDALVQGDVNRVGRMLHDPSCNRLLDGFESLLTGTFPADSDGSAGSYLYDMLARLAEATGATNLDYPETELSNLCPTLPIEELIGKIEETIRHKIDFPNPYACEVGLRSSRGPIGMRALNAIYQAKLVRDYSRAGAAVEIGAGLGRTAYYANRFGVRDYTIVDLPLTNVAQAFFLGTVLGPEAISLHGEPPAQISIIPPQDFFGSKKNYDAALNADSLTEMSGGTARSYINAVSWRSKYFISINHEFNPFTFRTIYADITGWRVSRNPYWMRNGYVLEIVEFSPTA